MILFDAMPLDLDHDTCVLIDLLNKQGILSFYFDYDLSSRVVAKVIYHIAGSADTIVEQYYCQTLPQVSFWRMAADVAARLYMRQRRSQMEQEALHDVPF